MWKHSEWQKMDRSFSFKEFEANLLLNAVKEHKGRRKARAAFEKRRAQEMAEQEAAFEKIFRERMQKLDKRALPKDKAYYDDLERRVDERMHNYVKNY